MTQTNPSWQLTGATQDAQSVTADWQPVKAGGIHGVRLLESRWVVKSNGRLAELFRADWFAGRIHVDQVFQVILNAHGISAWHVHGHTLDRLFIARGHARVVLYDARAESPSHGSVMELLLDEHRPQLVVVPPGVWHGVQSLDNAPATIVNMPDRAYNYESPDHWRLPPDTGEIPYSFKGVRTTGTAI
ncbi:MAG TPA: dTDP-4-dehydrorhamnose 3,5-epimerase family protein [Vicinamibacterales bacterium]